MDIENAPAAAGLATMMAESGLFFILKFLKEDISPFWDKILRASLLLALVIPIIIGITFCKEGMKNFFILAGNTAFYIAFLFAAAAFLVLIILAGNLLLPKKSPPSSRRRLNSAI